MVALEVVHEARLACFNGAIVDVYHEDYQFPLLAHTSETGGPLRPWDDTTSRRIVPDTDRDNNLPVRPVKER